MTKIKFTRYMVKYFHLVIYSNSIILHASQYEIGNWIQFNTLSLIWAYIWNVSFSCHILMPSHSLQYSYYLIGHLTVYPLAVWPMCDNMTEMALYSWHHFHEYHNLFFFVLSIKNLIHNYVKIKWLKFPIDGYLRWVAFVLCSLSPINKRTQAFFMSNQSIIF